MVHSLFQGGRTKTLKIVSFYKIMFIGLEIFVRLKYLLFFYRDNLLLSFSYPSLAILQSY